jgi:hypothetical protein
MGRVAGQAPGLGHPGFEAVIAEVGDTEGIEHVVEPRRMDELHALNCARPQARGGCRPAGHDRNIAPPGDVLGERGLCASTENVAEVVDAWAITSIDRFRKFAVARSSTAGMDRARNPATPDANG